MSCERPPLQFLWLIGLCLVVGSGCTREESENNSNSSNQNIPSGLIGPDDDESWKLVFDYPENFGDPVARWITVAENGHEADFNIVEDGLEENSYALEVRVNEVPEGDPWDIQVYQETVPIEPNELYYYSAWIKGPRGSQVNMGVETLEYLAVEYREVVLVGEWQNVVFEFIAHENALRTPIHFALPYNENKTFYVDQVRINQAN